MGIFHETVTLVNRTSQSLNVRYDGQEMTLKPGDNPGFPKIAVPYAKNQNPIMGTEDLINPLSFQFLVGVKGKDDCSPIEQSDAPQRIDRTELDNAPGVKQVILRGRKKPNVFDARAGISLSADGGVFREKDD